MLFSLHKTIKLNIHRKAPTRDGLSLGNLQIEQQNNKEILPLSKHTQNKNKAPRKKRKKTRESNTKKVKDVMLQQKRAQSKSSKKMHKNNEILNASESSAKESQCMDVDGGDVDENKNNNNDTSSEFDESEEETNICEITEELRTSLMPGNVRKSDRPRSIKSNHRCNLTLYQSDGGIICDGCDQKIRKKRYIYSCDECNFDLCYRCGIQKMVKILD